MLSDRLVACGAWLLLFTMLAALTACNEVAGAQNQETVASAAMVTESERLLSATATLPATQTASPESTSTETATSAPTSSATASVTETSLPTETSTASPSPTSRPTETATPLPTDTPIPSPTVTPPLPTPRASYEVTVTVPILMYHYISEPPADADIYRHDLSVTPEQFREQMTYLVDNNFTTIDFYELSLAIAGKQPLPPKPVLLTFDDGYVDAYENAFPILDALGLKGTFFIITEFVDRAYPAYMSWEMIETMSAAGQRMESHSKTHADLSEADYDELVWQILGSQETLAAHIGYTPRYFCFPGGRYDEQTVQVLSELDFWGAVTTASGKWHNFANRFEWSRLRIRDVTTIQEYAAMIEPSQ